MQRFAFFVDGSNLFGSLKAMNVEVDDYEAFFAYLYKESASHWHTSTHTPATVPTQLRRVYWYVVGSIDEWDLSLPPSVAKGAENCLRCRSRREECLARHNRKGQSESLGEGPGGQSVGRLLRQFPKVVRGEAQHLGGDETLSPRRTNQYRPHRCRRKWPLEG